MIFFRQKIILDVPQEGLTPQKVKFKSSCNNMLWVL